MSISKELRRVTMLLQFVSCELPDFCCRITLQKETVWGSRKKGDLVMTFGEKIKEARKEAGLSQQQFAEKMSVSRSAIAKWETDKGMPDVNNLKTMAQLLNVSVDYLLDDDEMISLNQMKEAIDLDQYEIIGRCRDKKDAVCYEKNKNATAIYALFKQKKLSKVEWLIDFLVQPGIVQVLDQFSDIASFYLVEKDNKQYLVKVNKEFIITNELAVRVNNKKFVVGNYQYKKGYQIV